MKNANIQKLVGQKIRELRIAADLTQQQVCADQISLRNYQQIEQGESNLTLKTLLAIANKLEVHPGFFFDFEWAGKTLCKSGPTKNSKVKK